MFVMKLGWRHSLFTLLVVALSLLTMSSAAAASFPDVIPLPDGFQPEGIAVGKGSTFYVGSISTGAVYRGDLRTGEGDILVPAQEGRAAIGLKYDDRTGYLFVAGGPTGYAYIYNGETGANVGDPIQLTTDQSFINDVVITKDAAYFTNSSQPILYKVPLENNGELSTPFTSVAIPLSGDYQQVPGFNANGIEATPDGKTLIIVNSTLGALYQVEPETGIATEIALEGGNVQSGDGILLQGKTLYVVQNFLNQIAVVRLSPDLGSGTIVETITNENFRIPTTIAKFGNSLYAVNARFDAPGTPTTDYDVVRVPR